MTFFSRIAAIPVFAYALAIPAQAQQPQLDQWTSIVPEGAMGQVIAMYFSNANPELSVNMICSQPSPWLEIGLNDQVLRQVRPSVRADEVIVFRAGGVSFQMEPYDEAKAYERSQRNIGRKWPEQDSFIAALYAGQPLEIYAGPPNDSAPLRLLGQLQGVPNDPGLAQVLAQCGGGAPAPGVAQPIPNEQQTWVGEWQLRERGENFPMPVAQVATMENGSAMGLFCDGEGQPSGYFTAGLTDTGIVEAAIGAQTFQFNAARYADHMIFRVSRDFLAALRSGSQARVGLVGAFSVTLSLNGAGAGMDHAYKGCAAPGF